MRYLSHSMQALAVVGAFAVAGCLETSQAGLPAGAEAKYARVALVADVSDAVVSSYWDAPFSEPQPTEGRLGWNAARATAELASQQLTETGASVTVVPSQSSAAAGASDVVVVLRQTPLDRIGQSYNPARDFLALGGGIIAIAAIADAETSKGQAHKPRFVLWLRNPAVSKAIIGENACTVGLTGTLIDPATGEARGGAVQVTGRSVIPDALPARTYGGLPEPDRARVLSHCRTALRSAVSQALLKMDVVK